MARTTRFTLVGVLLALVVGAACAPPLPSTHRDPTVIGDSITHGLVVTGNDFFGPEQFVSGVSGRAIASGGLDEVRAAVPHTWPGDKFMIEFGTNDVGWTSDVGWYRAQISALLDSIPRDRCVGWVLPYRANRPAEIDAWNNTVIDLLWQRPCFSIVDWHAAVLAEPGLVGSDGIHLTAAGNVRLHQMIADGLASMVLPPVLIPPTSVVPTT